MEDYAKSLEEVTEIRRMQKGEKLKRLEMKEYRKFTGNMRKRPDLSFTALQLAKKNNNSLETSKQGQI